MWNGMLEIEIKVRVPDLVPVRERILLGHEGTPVKVHERDIYYNAPHRDFGITDEALRLRYAGGSCTLTYKGKKKSEYRLKAREELICGVDPGEMTELIHLSRSRPRGAPGWKTRRSSCGR